jgi:transcription elongation factor Elf1
MGYAPLVVFPIRPGAALAIGISRNSRRYLSPQVISMRTLECPSCSSTKSSVVLATRESTSMRCTVCESSWVTETLAGAPQVDRRHASLERRAVTRGGRRTRDVNRKLHRD